MSRNTSVRWTAICTAMAVKRSLGDEDMQSVCLTTDIEALLEQTATLHKHLCPRQVLGVRMGMLAAEMMPIELPQAGKRLLTFVETDGCFADGVSVATGCSMGHRTLRLVDFGKVAATFVDTETGRAIRIAPAPNARTLAAEYVPGAKSRWHSQLEAYQLMPSTELLIAREVTLALDLAAIVGKPGMRITCSACGEEVLNQRIVMENEQPLCRSCAGEKYWTPKQ